MAIADDISIDVSGNIRRAVAKASMNNYTTIALHRFLGGLSDDASSAGDDYVDASRPVASERQGADNYIIIKPPFNIDADLAEHIYGGTILQTNGDERWDPVTVLAAPSTPIEIIQNEVPVTPNFFQSGINADTANGVSHKFLLKVRSAAADIDGRRFVVQGRPWGKQHSEFKINGSDIGVNVAALSASDDSNNVTAEATIESYTTIVNLTQGYRQLDVDNNGTPEEYYSEWDRAAYTKNDLYERAKWLSGMPRTEDICADTGSDFAIGNGTITEQGQAFSNGVNATFPRRLKVDLKKTGSPTGTITANIYTHSGTFGTSSVPTGATLLASATIDVSKLDTAYREVQFGFQTAVSLTASTNYVVALTYAGGDASNYVQVRGLATTGTHAGNRSQKVGTWSASANDDLKFNLETCGSLYGLPGNIFRGVTHQVALTTPRTGSFAANERVTWTGGTGQMLAIDSVATGTKMWIQVLSGVAPTTGLTITGASTATATTTGTALERDTPQKGALPFIGQSTGSALFGGHGTGIQLADLTSADRLRNLNNDLMTPPNNVQFTVSGLVSGEDYVLIAPLAYFLQYDNEAGGGSWTDGETLTFSGAGTAKLLQVQDEGTTGYMWVRMLTGAVPADNESITGGASSKTANVNQAPQPEIDHEQLTLSGTLNGGTVTSVVVSEAIPSWTPATGNVRIRRDSGRTTTHPYSAVNTGTKTFTITSHSFVADPATTGTGVCVAPIDKLATATSHSFTGVYTSDVSLFFRRRDGGASPTKPQEQAITLASTGGSITAIRQSDE